MPSNFELVGLFLKKFDLPAYEPGGTPLILDDQTFLFRLQLILEEAQEILAAHRSGDILKIADAVADLLVVTYGLGHCYNIPVDRVFKLVMDANMRKERATGADDPRGKRGSALDLVKPPGWEPPDLSEIL